MNDKNKNVEDSTRLSNRTVNNINIVVILSVILGMSIVIYFNTLNNVFMFGGLVCTVLIMFALERLGEYIIK